MFILRFFVWLSEEHPLIHAIVFPAVLATLSIGTGLALGVWVVRTFL